MQDTYNYDHSHAHDSQAYDNIIFTMFLNLFFAILEFVSFLLTGSMAMLSSSIHDFGDVLIFFFTSIVENYSTKGRSQKYTYGYRRFTVVGALINAVILTLGSILIIPNAIEKLLNPTEITAGIVLIMAVLGIIVNKLGVRKLKQNDSLINNQLVLNLQADVYNFYVILLGAVLMLLFDLYYIDSLFAIGIAVLMIFHIFEALKEVFDILMQSVPKGFSIDNIVEHIRQCPGVMDVHDLHLWSLDGEDNIFTCHIVVDDKLSIEQVITIHEEVKETLLKLGISHTTIEVDNLATAIKNGEIDLYCKRTNDC